MQSMDEIYQSYAKTVYKYLMSQTHSEDLAEELTQETFYQAIRTIDRYDGSCRISTWLCAIAKNVLITPHVSGFYHLPETHERIIRIAAENLAAFRDGKEMRNLVDFETGYRMFKG